MNLHRTSPPLLQSHLNSSAKQQYQVVFSQNSLVDTIWVWRCNIVLVLTGLLLFHTLVLGCIWKTVLVRVHPKLSRQSTCQIYLGSNPGRVICPTSFPSLSLCFLSTLFPSIQMLKKAKTYSLITTGVKLWPGRRADWPFNNHVHTSYGAKLDLAHLTETSLIEFYFNISSTKKPMNITFYNAKYKDV